MNGPELRLTVAEPGEELHAATQFSEEDGGVERTETPEVADGLLETELDLTADPLPGCCDQLELGGIAQWHTVRIDLEPRSEAGRRVTREHLRAWPRPNAALGAQNR